MSEPPVPGFDAYAGDYDEALGQGLALSGEDKHYFAHGRIAWLRTRLARIGVTTPTRVLDFGCGTGTATPYLIDVLGARQVIGVDESAGSLDVARQQWKGRPARFDEASRFAPAHDVDLAFCNGVFHHVPPSARLPALGMIRQSLRPGGVFAFWENNPWNPGTRLVMRRIPFDRDAILVSPIEARRLLRAAGFEILETSFLFVFPRLLRVLRPVEPALSALPLGGQYQVICRPVKPNGPSA